MEFEDIVDMDWLNSNTTTDESLLSSTASPSLVPIKNEPLNSFSTSTDYCHDPALYGFSDQSLMWQNDFTTTTTDLEMLDPTSPCSPASSLPDKQQEQETSQQEKNSTAIGAAQQTDVAPQSQPAIAPMPDMVMPSTEHIKQLIEIAKQHLALREQQQQQQQQGGQKQSKQQSKQQIILNREEQTEKEQSQQQEISQQSGDLQRLYNETGPISFFVHPTAVSNVPDTVAPESLMKSSSNNVTVPTTSSSSSSTTTTPTTDTTAATSSASTPPSNKEQENAKASSPPPTSSSSEQQQNGLANRRASSVSLAGASDEAMTLEAYAVSDGIDIKKLTPKERRQLRNKISARNFRVRRKEYISTLEGQVDEHKKHAEQLKSRLDHVEDENKQLRLEVDTLRRQNQLLQQQQQKNAVTGSSSPGSPRVSSPIPKPSLNKDISMLGSKASDTYRHDTRILVSNAVMPVWDFDRIFTGQQQEKSSMVATRYSQQQQQQQFLAPPEQVLQCAGYIVTLLVQLHCAAEGVSLPPPNTNFIIELEDDSVDEQILQQQQKQMNKIEVPLLPDDRDFTSESDAWEKPTAVPPTFASPAYMEYLYDTLIMSALTTNTHTDKSFWWWDTPMFHQ